MSEITFRSPGAFEREIDLSAPRVAGPVGIPAGVIGTSPKGPAFVPVTVANFSEFQEKFGNLDTRNPATYAVNEYLKHKSSLTFVRVLGAGACNTDGDISTAENTGRVKNAGVYLDGSAAADDSYGRHVGCVQFITARHELTANEALGMPLFTDNNSFDGSYAHLVRGMVMMASGARLMVLDGNETTAGKFIGAGPDDAGTVISGKIKLVISSTLGSNFSNDDKLPGIKIFTASLDPSSNDYYGKVLNTDPKQFVEKQHLLYTDFAVDNELATPVVVGVLSGSANVSLTSGDTTLAMRKAFGAFNARFSSAKTTKFISQPYGSTEYDLFYFETLDDGANVSCLYKVSIANVKASTDQSNKYGTFTVQIRDWNDTDANPVVLESFGNCSLDPRSENYISKKIGDRKVYFDFDASATSERRLTSSGRYNNNSKFVRVVVTDAVERRLVPEDALPFGFHGAEVIKTNDLLTDTSPTAATAKIAGVLGVGVASSLSGSVLPPVPYRHKVTRGSVPLALSWAGQPGPSEAASPQLYWGVKFERNDNPLNNNLSSEKNKCVESYTKFLGIKKLDTLTTGSGADTFCNNKFTLAKVAFSNTSVTDLTASINDHMREAAYIRDALVDNANYTVSSSIGYRVTFATVLSEAGATEFNRFSTYTKFTNFFQGGYDGLNFLDDNASRMNDRATSFDESGCAEATYVSPGLLNNVNGVGQNNNAVSSYVSAINMMTDPMSVRVNVLTIPGIRDTFVTDYALQRVKEYGLAFYIMDIPSYSDANGRLYDDSTGRNSKPSVQYTISALEARAIDNNFAAVYFPNVYLTDEVNNRRVKLPSSVAALGALAFNDKVGYPWFAPAGFNRAALDFVSNVEVRLNSIDRDMLYEARINPIALFPREAYVIFGQKTLQVAKSALDRINVRRMLVELKHTILDIASKFAFEQNTAATRNRFKSEVLLKLGLVQANAGIETFDVIMDERINTIEDVNLNRLRGKIIIVPTRSVEFISIDYIVSQSGVTFM